MFYKLENDLIKSQYVHSLHYFLASDTKDEYTYPIDGWYWFDTDDEAKEFFGIE